MFIKATILGTLCGALSIGQTTQTPVTLNGVTNQSMVMMAGALSANVSGLNNVLSYAPGITINDGAPHTISAAPAGTVFNGLTTLAGIAAIKINGATPFAWLTAQSSPFAFVNDLLAIGFSDGGSGGTDGTFSWTASGGCSVVPTGQFTVTKGIVTSIWLMTHGSGCTSTPTFDLTASSGLSGAIVAATVLTDSNASSIDITWLAAQSALLSFHAYFPAGKYIIGSTLALPLEIVGGSEAGGSLSSGYAHIRGDGEETSIIQSGSDWGFGYRLAVCGDPGGTRQNGFGRYGNQCTGDMKDMGFKSSASNFLFNPGVVGYKMDGLATGSHLRLLDVTSWGFYNNFNLVGDHNKWIRAHSFGGVRSVYWDWAINGVIGDLMFDDANWQGASQAAIAINGNSTLTAHFAGETYLSAPYAILGESNGCQAMASGVEFDRLMVEFIGNGVFVDDNGYDTVSGTYTDSNKCRSMNHILIHALYMNWSNSKFWGGAGLRQRRAAFDLKSLSIHVQDLMCDSSGCWNPNFGTQPSGSTALSTFRLSLNNDSVWDNSIAGNVDYWVSSSGSLPLTSPFVPGGYWDLNGRSWKGSIVSVNAQANHPTSISGDLIEADNVNSVALNIGGTASPGNALPVGVIMQGGVTYNVNNGLAMATSGSPDAVVVNTAFGSNSTPGPYSMGSGLGATLGITAGSGGTDGSYAWTSSGGGCVRPAKGTITVLGGIITAAPISDYGYGCTSRPSVAIPGGTSLSGASLSTSWPSGLSEPSSNTSPSVVGVWNKAVTTATGANTAAIALEPALQRPPTSAETVSFSATPTFSTLTSTSIMTLTGDVTSFTLPAGVDGQAKTLVFCQDGSGGHAVTAPANVHGFSTPGVTADKCSTQNYSYIVSQTAWLALSAGIPNQ